MSVIPKTKNLRQSEYRSSLIFPPFSIKSSSKSTISPKTTNENNPQFKLNAVMHFSRYENQNQEHCIQ